MEAYRQKRLEVEFEDSTKAFEDLRGFLGSSAALGLDHAVLEREISLRGRDVLRRLYQDQLRLRARQEKSRPVTGADEVVRTHFRAQSRPLMTVFGPVRVERLGVSARGRDSLFPLDAELKLPAEEHSHGVRERVAIEASKGSFDAAVDAVTTTTGAHVSKRQAEKLTAEAARDFDVFYAQRPSREVVAEKDEIVVLTMDGKGIVVRHEELREQTRRAAESGKHKLRTRLSKGEKRNRKRMATVAAVYSVAPHVRTAEDIVGDLRPVQETGKPRRPKPKHKRVWASVAKEPVEIVGELFDEACGRDPRRERSWVAVVDGNATQLELLETEARNRSVTLVVVLDLIHALEYLWKAAYCFHADGTPAAEAWVTERLRALLAGKVSDVAAGIRRSATKRGLAADVRRPADVCANYLLNHRQYMRYDEYLAAGLPVASGVIEGACRHLVKDRMDLTGARWTLAGAEAVLRVRALRSSGDFAAYWAFHLQAEYRRNHSSRYAAPQAKPDGAPHLRLVTS
jgi:hypothetical protein